MDAELVARKVTQAEKALARVRGRLPASVKAFSRDYDAQDIVYRNFVIAVQNCVDISAHIIAVERLEPPASMGGVFGVLAAHGRLTAAQARRLRDLVTLRNIIVHDYARIDLKRAFPLLKSGLTLVPDYCRAIFARS